MADASDIPVAALNVPVLYANSLAVGVSSTDVNVVLMLDNQPQFRVHMSFTTAKTLERHLADAFKKLESATGHEIMVASEVEKGLRKLLQESQP